MPYRQVQVSGFPAVALRSQDIEVVVVPALAGKVTNLRRLRGREWLWRNDQMPLAPPRAGASYVETADSGGWDECFPTVGPCPMPGVPGLLLPDHGELWTLPWENRVYDFAGGTALTGTVKGHLLPYDFHREIILDGEDPVVRFQYRLRHSGDQAFPWIWSAHPLLNVQPGTTLRLASIREVKVDSAFERNEKKGEVIPWPPAGGEAFRFPDTERWALKLFGTLEPSGRAILQDPRQDERLELVFPTETVSHLGIWINCRRWAPDHKRPYYNLALEPCIGAPDRLDDAVETWNLAQVLHPGETREWGFEVWLPAPS